MTEIDWKQCPESVKGPLQRYYFDGIPPGDFLLSILKGEYMHAALRADRVNQLAFVDILKFRYSQLPLKCLDREVTRWITKGGTMGEPQVSQHIWDRLDPDDAEQPSA